MGDAQDPVRALTRRRALLGGLSLAGVALPMTARLAAAIPEGATGDAIPLWPDDPPGGEHVAVTEEVIARPPPPGLLDRIARGVRQPTLTPFLPQGTPRAAVLIIPGGGYKHVVIDKEGFETARWLAREGLAAFVLRYRLPGDGWAAGPDAPLQDAQRALRLMRAHCERIGVRGDRTVVLGFSAGGHLAARLATRFSTTTYAAIDAVDRGAARPDTVALLYPVITMTGEGVHAGSRNFLLGPAATEQALEQFSAHLGVVPGTPPMFLVHAADDAAVPLRNTQLMFDALRAAQVPADLHVFARGGHGFGLRGIAGLPVGGWPRLLVDWISRQPGFERASQA